MATDVAAGRGVEMQCALIVTVGGQFFESVPNNRTVTSIELVQRANFAGCNIFRKALERRQVLDGEVLRGFERG
ncbi:hypothetical protein ACVWXN_000291 [Bradyrhizobium sp. i1.4.4]